MKNLIPQQSPLDEYLSRLKNLVSPGKNFVITAEPGSGKTTKIPLHLTKLREGKVLVLEPRRLAAKLAAQYVAKGISEPVGESIGYRMRHETRCSPNTRLEYVTEGILLRMVQENPELLGYHTIIIDEFHERGIYSDLSLAVIKYIQIFKRPDINIFVMSATLDTSGVASFLDAQVKKIPGNIYPCDIVYNPSFKISRGYYDMVNAVSCVLADSRCRGHILVFLSGIKEIRYYEQELRQSGCFDDFEILPLAAELSAEAQERVFTPSVKRKIIFTTNVAESSVTIPGVNTVIDLGFAKISGFAPWSGLPTLSKKPVAKASLTQRAGRAAREQKGLVYRLMEENDVLARPDFDVPEIKRVALDSYVLQLFSLPYFNKGTVYQLIDDFPWFESPDAMGLKEAISLLSALQAISSEGKLTMLGKELAELPIAPRLGKAILESRSTPYLREVILSSVLLADPRYRIPRDNHASSSNEKEVHPNLAQNLESLMAKMRALLYSNEPHHKNSTKLNSFHHGSERLFKPFRQIGDILGISPDLGKQVSRESDYLSKIYFSAYFDRVAKKLPKGRHAEENTAIYMSVGGRSALFRRDGTTQDLCPEYILILSAEDKITSSKLGQPSTFIRTFLPITEEMLLESTQGLLKQETTTSLTGNKSGEKTTVRIKYGEILVKEYVLAGDSEMGKEFLVSELKRSWPEPFSSEVELKIYNVRASLINKFYKEANLPIFEDDFFEMLISHIADGSRNYASIVKRSLSDYIEDLLTWQQIQFLGKLTPLQITMSNGARVKIDYRLENEAVVRDHIQYFFGLKDTPTILSGRLKLKLELLGPHKRPLQITEDLSGFWQRSYKEMHGALKRRYPRHLWPSEPESEKPFLLLSRRK